MEKRSHTSHTCLFVGVIAVLAMSHAAWAAVKQDTPNLPPDGEYLTPTDVHARYEGQDLEIVLSNVVHTPFVGGPQDPRDDGVGTSPGVIRETDPETGDETETFGSTLTADAEVNGTDVGQVTLTGPVTTIVRGKGGNTTGTFQTEIVSMSLTGTIAGFPITIRESPTEASTGETTVSERKPAEFVITSFFDVFTEVDIQFSETVTITLAADGPIRVDVVPTGNRTPVIDTFERLDDGTCLITGKNFGDIADNLCVVIMDGNRAIPLQAILAVDTAIIVAEGPVPPDAVGGPVAVALGEGNRDGFVPNVAGVDPGNPEDTWVWDFRGPEAIGPIVQPVPKPPSGFVWFFSGQPVDGKLCIFISGNWPPNAMVQVSGRVHHHGDPRIGHDLLAANITLPDGGSTIDCAFRICDVLACAWSQQLGVQVNCFAEEVVPGVAKITISLPGLPIGWGNVTICVKDDEPPEVACLETVNPHGKTVPPAGKTTLPGPKGGQNEDGFYELLAVDNFDLDPDIFVVDTGSGEVFGPFSSGDKVKYTEANGAEPGIKNIGSSNGQAGAVAAHINGTGDMAVFAVDAVGNESPLVSCLVPPPPK